MENLRIGDPDQAQEEADLVHRHAVANSQEKELNPDHYIEASKYIDELLQALGSTEAVAMVLNAKDQADSMGLKAEFDRANTQANQILKFMMPATIQDIRAQLGGGRSLDQLIEDMADFLADGSADYFFANKKIYEAYEKDSEKVCALVGEYIATLKLYINKGLHDYLSEKPKEKVAPSAERSYLIKSEEIVWPNGNRLKFVDDKTITDEGEELVMSRAFLEYKKRGEESLTTIDISDYIPGKTILFAQANPQSRCDARGVIFYNGPEEVYCYLNSASIAKTNIGILYILHEIGHIESFGHEEELLGRLEEESAADEKPLPKGGEVYQERLQKLVDELKEYILVNGGSTQKPEPIPSEQDDETANEGSQSFITEYESIYTALTSGELLDDQQSSVLNEIHPQLAVLLSVISERYAQAFAVREIRKLDPDIYMFRKRVLFSTRRILELFDEMRGPVFSPGARGSDAEPQNED